ncbi:type I-E CRISPR-associated protein Cse1/CasA [Streptomyces sp. AV19]|uniref:type I-E CRISPR-associated protein Cse1/CasA n=1 Tax=Streptomyces sp. AV19 TaxID=2793068 RepID=UPI0018FEAED5|nr:type I-E CRISPR-associated protein Cse1/CasA [Streptomyces sp. AV19]MBH1938278.1 type I-E CRISPR-associated protein Cse1/CasA [Streptomyces sp. AV19]MDG4534908.1 type I-E CRISPR-associated protein Cse1/CasA [Streptomyces sp. AV19]
MFNILDEPWLTVRPAASGPAEEVGVRQLLLEADRFADLVVDLPTQKPAIFRQLLLPIVVDALGRPANAAGWADRFRAESFARDERERLDAYFDEHRHHFDLFHPDDPFAQVPGLRTAKGETKGSALLVATAATGNNVPLFASRTEGDPLELTPAEAARWLLHTHCWDTAAIKTGAVGDSKVKAGKTTGNPTGPLGQLGVVMPVGRTLYETLLLNIPFGQALLGDDLPQWKRRDAGHPLSCATPAWESRAPRGLLDTWTWQSRRIRLIPEETAAGLRVTRVIVAAGDRIRLLPDHEPHTAWAVDTRKPTAKSAPPSYRPRRHQPGRAAWRGLDALLAVNGTRDERTGFQTSELLRSLAETRERLPSAYPLQLELTGITYGNQSAVIEDVFFDEIPLPVAALDPDGIVYDSLLEAVDQAEKLANAVNLLSADLRRAAGADPIPWDKGQRPGDTLLHALDPLVRRLLTGLRTAGEDFERSERGLEAWEQRAGREAWQVAEQVLATAAPGVFTGRTVTRDGKDSTFRLSTAERGFRSRVDGILTRRTAARRATAS